MIPLRLQKGCGKILWTNQTPQSTRFCRTQRIEFAKESKEYVIRLKEKYDKEIAELEEVVIILMSGKKLLNVICV